MLCEGFSGRIFKAYSCIDNDQEFLLDAADAASAEAEVMVPEAVDAENSMAIDEEGRPRFAPSKDIV